MTWIIRRADAGQMFGGKANDQLPERGRLGADAQHAVEQRASRTRHRVPRSTASSTTSTEPPSSPPTARRPGRSTGSSTPPASGPTCRPLTELRVDVDPVLQSARTLAPMIDPNVHSCGSVPPHGAAELAHPEPGFYIVGAKSYGRAPTFLLATGYEQVRSVVAELAGDRAAAADVQLILPETGVCSLDRSPDSSAAVSELVTVPDAAAACCN